MTHLLLWVLRKHFFRFANNSEAFASELLEMFFRYYMGSDVISRRKSSIIHWCVTSHKRVKTLLKCFLVMINEKTNAMDVLITLTSKQRVNTLDYFKSYTNTHTLTHIHTHTHIYIYTDNIYWSNWVYININTVLLYKSLRAKLDLYVTMTAYNTLFCKYVCPKYIYTFLHLYRYRETAFIISYLQNSLH